MMKYISLIMLLYVLCSFGCSSKEIILSYENASLITKKDLSSYSQYSPDFYLKNYGSDQVFIVVTFISEVDLIKFSMDNSVMVFNKAYFCDEPKKEAKLSLSPIFYNNEDIDLIKINRKKNKIDNEKDIFSYGLIINSSNFMDIQSSEYGKKIEYYSKFDLIREPKDVCIRVYGAGFMFNVKSNIMVLKKVDIENLFK